MTSIIKNVFYTLYNEIYVDKRSIYKNTHPLILQNAKKKNDHI